MKRLALIPLATLALTGPAIADVNRMDGGGFSWNLPYTTEAGDPAQRIRDNGPGRCPNGVNVTFSDGYKRLRWYADVGLSCQRDAPNLVNVDPDDALPRVTVIDADKLNRGDALPLTDGTPAQFLNGVKSNGAFVRIVGKVKYGPASYHWRMKQWNMDGTPLPGNTYTIDMGKVPTREVVRR